MSNETTNVGFYGISFEDEKNRIKNIDKGKYSDNLEPEKIKDLFDKNGAIKLEPEKNKKEDFEAYVKGMKAKEEAEKARAAKASLRAAIEKAKEEEAKEDEVNR